MKRADGQPATARLGETANKTTIFIYVQSVFHLFLFNVVSHVPLRDILMSHGIIEAGESHGQFREAALRLTKATRKTLRLKPVQLTHLDSSHGRFQLVSARHLPAHWS